MKLILLVSLLSTFTIKVLSQTASKQITGILVNSINNSPISGWEVKNLTSPLTGQNPKTDNSGNFTITADQNDFLEFTDNKGSTEVYQIDVNDYNKGSILVSATFSKSAGSAITSQSYWLGATLGYNIGGNSTEDVVGSAKVVINPLLNKFLLAKWGIIGNFANFQSTQNKEDIEKTARKIIQTTQGLFLGAAGIWRLGGFSNQKDNSNNWRIQYTVGGRLNGFSKVGPDSSNVDLWQFRNSLGLEFEGLKFKNGGLLNLSVEGSLTNFDKNQYGKIFNERKGSVFSIEETLILPFAANNGVIFNLTQAAGHKPIFLVGVIFKDISSSGL